MIPPTDPLRMFLQAYLTQVVSHFTLVGLVFLVVWKLGEKRFAASRIQRKKRVDRRQLWFETKNTLVTLAVGTASAVAVSFLYARGSTRLTSDRHALGWPAIIGGLLLFLVFNDLWFYCWHRLLHRPTLFRHVHAVHHKSVDVNPFSVYSFHPIEALILGSAVIPFVLLVPMYLPVLAVAQVIGLANNVMSHLGYEFLPRWYGRIPPFSFMNTATFHNLHHTELRGNYGLLFRFWDRLFGTELRGYERAFLERGTPLERGAPTQEVAAEKAP